MRGMKRHTNHSTPVISTCQAKCASHTYHQNKIVSIWTEKTCEEPNYRRIKDKLISAFMNLLVGNIAHQWHPTMQCVAIDMANTRSE